MVLSRFLILKTFSKRGRKWMVKLMSIVLIFDLTNTFVREICWQQASEAKESR